MTEQTIFTAALERQPSDRPAFLDEACGTDKQLRERVEKLLRLHDDAGSFLESPAAESSPTVSHPVTEKPGDTIGPYKLLEQIGEGGMGVVYMAEQTEPIGRKVALKIIKPGMDTRQVIARFEAEQQALSLMDHPNIAKVLDAGATDTGRPYFVMELVKGVPVTQYCDQHQLTPRQRLELFLPVCQAIQHAHQKSIIHRDIKPSNVLVCLYDGKPVPKVIDFGVAKAISQPLTEKTMFTGFGQVVGTLEYMSPEQAQVNQLDIDTRSDIYALGVLLYELLTGTTPFDRQRLRSAAWDEMLRIIREEEPPKPSTRLSDSKDLLPSISAERHTDPAKLAKLVRGELDWIVMKAMEKDRNRRYETANSLANDIQHYLKDESVVACPPSAAYRFSKFARRNKAALSIAGLILSFLVVLGSAIGWTIRDREAREQEIVRERTARQARVSQQVELILDEAARFGQQQQWSAALGAARRAEAVLASGEASEDLPARVHQVVSDLELVARLEDIRLLPSKTTVGGFGYGDANQSYSAALREHGLDLDTLPPDEAVRRLQSRRGVLPALIVALDDWAACRLAVEDETGAKALGELAQALDADPWRRRLRDARTHGSGKALEELVRSEELAGQPPSTIELLAGALEHQDRRADALEILGRMLQVHPDDFWLHMKTAAAHSSSNPPRKDEALRHYTAALALRPRSAAVHYNHGIVLKDQGRLDEAKACYRRALELDPKFSQAHTNLGGVLKAQGQLDEAIVCFRRALELDPKLAPAHRNLGNVLKDQGKLDEAIAYYRQAIELDPKFGPDHTTLGTALKVQGRLDEAIACFRRAIELGSQDAKVYNNLGVTLADQGKLDEAIACFRQAVAADPQDVMAHYNLGIVLKDQGRLDEAIACYRQAIEINPKLAPVYNNLAWVLATANEIELRNPSEATDLARTAVQLDPKYWGFWDTLSVAAYRAGDWKTSLSARQEKLRLHPIATDDRLFLAMTHWQLGDKAEARKWYEETTSQSGNEETTSTRLTNLHHEAKQLLGITTSPIEAKDNEPR